MGDGQAAIDVVREIQPDIVLSDVMMPRMNGIDLLKALRQDSRTRNTGVTLISARAGDEAGIQSLEAGSDEYLVKPFQSGELLARVRNLFALKRSRDALQQELESHEASLTEFTRQLIISERSLQRSEACLAEAQRLTRIGSCVWNASTRELSWSAEHCRSSV